MFQFNPLETSHFCICCETYVVVCRREFQSYTSNTTSNTGTGGGGLASLKAVRVALAASLKASNTADYAFGFSLKLMMQTVRKWEGKNSIGFIGSMISGVRLALPYSDISINVHNQHSYEIGTI